MKLRVAGFVSPPSIFLIRPLSTVTSTVQESGQSRGQAVRTVECPQVSAGAVRAMSDYTGLRAVASQAGSPMDTASRGAIRYRSLRRAREYLRCVPWVRIPPGQVRSNPGANRSCQRPRLFSSICAGGCMADLTGRMIGAMKADVATLTEIENDPSAMGQALTVIVIAGVASLVGNIFRAGIAAGIF